MERINFGGNEAESGVEIVEARNVTLDDCAVAITGGAQAFAEAGVLVSAGGSARVVRGRFENLPGPAVRIVDSPGSVIGGATDENGAETPVGNRILNCGAGVEIVGAASSQNEVSFNEITALDIAAGQNNRGIFIQDAPENRIIGNTIEALEDPIQIVGPQARGNQVQRNAISRGALSGDFAVAAVVLGQGASDNAIGAQLGQDVGAGNDFTGFAVAVGVVAGSGNTILGNRYRGVEGGQRPFPVDLAFDRNAGPQPTPNDDDTAPGREALPNRLQNHPEIKFIPHSGEFVLGLLDSAPNESFHLEFLADAGARVLGSEEVTTDAQGRGLFRFNVVEPATGIMATATDRFGNTSETSPLLAFYSVNSPRGDGDTADNNLGDGFNLTGFNLPDGRPECSLRAAIEDANALLRNTPNARALVFFQIFFEGATPLIRVRDNPLPLITAPMTMGAEFDPALVAEFVAELGVAPELFQINPFTDLDGAALTTEPPASGLRAQRAVAHLRNLGVSAFRGEAVVIDESIGSRVEGCVLNNNGRAGILVRNSPAFLIESNFVGVTKSGIPAGNLVGIEVRDSDTAELGGVIRQNAIGGSVESGIDLENCRGLTIVGNRIGVFSEVQFAPNAFSGIVVRGNSIDNTIGGEQEGDGNFITDNGRNGIALIGPGVTGTRILGNVIGDPFSGGGVANKAAGILIQESSGNQVGDPGAASNRILQHPSNGLEIVGSAANPARNNRVQGNIFEANNQAGILLDFAEDNLIGPAPQQGLEFANEMFGAQLPAIRVVRGLRNIFSRNSIFNNDAGIRLENDSHAGLRAPVIQSVSHDGAQLRVTLDVVINRVGEHLIEFFANPSALPPGRSDCDSGRVFLGGEALQFASVGIERTTVVLNLAELPGKSLSATVTSSEQGTSAFALCHPLVPNDRDGDGAPDAQEEQLNSGSADNPGISAVPGFSPEGEPLGSFAISGTPLTPGGEARFTSSTGFSIRDAPVAPPPGVEFPIGAFSFTIAVGVPGGSAQLRLAIPPGITNNCLYKLARTTPAGPIEWFCLTSDIAQFDFARNEWVFTLTDGQLGDIDFETDAIIRDPIAPAFDPALPPLSPSIRLTITRRSDGSFAISFLGTAGTRYQLQFTPTLTGAINWSDLGEAITALQNGPLTLTDSPAATTGFYRVVRGEAP